MLKPLDERDRPLRHVICTAIDAVLSNGVNLTVASIQLLFPDTFNAFADTLV